MFPSSEIFERKAHAEAIRLDLLLFGRPAVTAAILAVVDKMCLGGVCWNHTQPSPDGISHKPPFTRQGEIWVLVYKLGEQREQHRWFKESKCLFFNFVNKSIVLSLQRHRGLEKKRKFMEPTAPCQMVQFPGEGGEPYLGYGVFLVIKVSLRIDKKKDKKKKNEKRC